jgi:hypothetical protein
MEPLITTFHRSPKTHAAMIGEPEPKYLFSGQLERQSSKSHKICPHDYPILYYFLKGYSVLKDFKKAHIIEVCY